MVYGAWRRYRREGIEQERCRCSLVWRRSYLRVVLHLLDQWKVKCVNLDLAIESVSCNAEKQVRSEIERWRSWMYADRRRVWAADSTLGIPMVASEWRTCRWRFDISTTSGSIIPILPEGMLDSISVSMVDRQYTPIPAAQRYWRAGQPSPPAPTTSTLAFRSLNWASGSRGKDFIYLFMRSIL